jgi:hypothetical protein
MKDWKDTIRMESTNVPISRPILCQKATDIAPCLKTDNFKASSGRFHRHVK